MRAASLFERLKLKQLPGRTADARNWNSEKAIETVSVLAGSDAMRWLLNWWSVILPGLLFQHTERFSPAPQCTRLNKLVDSTFGVQGILYIMSHEALLLVGVQKAGIWIDFRSLTPDSALVAVSLYAAH